MVFLSGEGGVELSKILYTAANLRHFVRINIGKSGNYEYF